MYASLIEAEAQKTAQLLAASSNNRFYFKCVEVEQYAKNESRCVQGWTGHTFH